MCAKLWTAEVPETNTENNTLAKIAAGRESDIAVPALRCLTHPAAGPIVEEAIPPKMAQMQDLRISKRFGHV